ncbi:ROK family protein [Paenarthrobacter nicotinovorans]|uniref:ROK family protein n=1 Tax=Paenarthrobacter nicotinovorans TaxID=29320 RepID=UPI0006854763
MVNARTGTIISIHLTPGLNGLEVGPQLRERYGVPVLVDHHPRVQALGDRWFGLGRHLQDFASAYTGEALGFGIVYQGAIVRGKDGAGGESGHTTVQLDGAPCRCGRQGCWETVATLGWLRDRAAELQLPQADSMDSAALVALSTKGNAAAAELLDLYARNLTVGMANNEEVFGSGTYIMHGDVCGGGETMRTAIQAWMTKLPLGRGAAGYRPLCRYAGSHDSPGRRRTHSVLNVLHNRLAALRPEGARSRMGAYGLSP